jgi:hypothetical protein
MPVIVRLSSGETYRLDRGLMTHNVVTEINNKRGTGKLVEFQNDATPSRAVYFDPDLVSSIYHDGYNY